jgi:hypothetical protein
MAACSSLHSSSRCQRCGRVLCTWCCCFTGALLRPLLQLVIFASLSL